MHHHASDAFILGTYPLRERDRIVVFLTRDAGKKRGVARGSRGPKSAFSGALEPMTEARVLYFEKEGRELVSLNSADVIRSSFPIAKDLDRGLLLSAFAESLQTFVSDSEPAEPFYRLARHALDGLFAGPLDPAARPPGLLEVSTVARRARRHFLGHELKSQRVLAELKGE
ncbi:MAG: DNA repair protein RecO [Acidobacteria bacterium]|nr:DNA repair protein RecO [Acidobacteriota bacterium]